MSFVAAALVPDWLLPKPRIRPPLAVVVLTHASTVTALACASGASLGSFGLAPPEDVTALSPEMAPPTPKVTEVAVPSPTDSLSTKTGPLSPRRHRCAAPSARTAPTYAGAGVAEIVTG